MIKTVIQGMGLSFNFILLVISVYLLVSREEDRLGGIVLSMANLVSIMAILM